MIFLKRLFRKQKVSSPHKDDSLLPRQICGAINNIAIDVFKHFSGQLMDKSAYYVVQAVWGTEINGAEPTSLQIEIHKKIELRVLSVYSKIKHANIEQSLINIFLIRELISAKLNYMIAATKKSIIEQRSISMTDIEVIGSA
jgi:hypothetical protein